MLDEIPEKIDKILVVNLFELEDIIFTIPMLENLKKNCDQAQIDMVGKERYQKIKESLDIVDNYYPYDESMSLVEKYKFAKRLATEEYDLGISVDDLFSSALFMKLVGPKYTAGYDGGVKSILFDHLFVKNESVHMVDMYLHFLEEIGIENVKYNAPKMSVSENKLGVIDRFLAAQDVESSDKLVGINVSTRGNKLKTWNKEGFAKLADTIIEDYGAKIIYYSAPEDVSIIKEVIGLMEHDALIAGGEIALEYLPALAKRCQLFISGDSGEIHVASAVGTKTITLFGPTDPKRFKPYAKQAKVVKRSFGCRDDEEGNVVCAEGIGVEDILEKVEL